MEQEFKDNPKDAIQKYSQFALPNTLIHQIVVGSLGLVVVLITLGIVWRVAFGTPVKDADKYPHRPRLGSHWGFGGFVGSKSFKELKSYVIFKT